MPLSHEDFTTSSYYPCDYRYILWVTQEQQTRLFSLFSFQTGGGGIWTWLQVQLSNIASLDIIQVMQNGKTGDLVISGTFVLLPHLRDRSHVVLYDREMGDTRPWLQEQPTAAPVDMQIILQEDCYMSGGEGQNTFCEIYDTMCPEGWQWGMMGSGNYDTTTVAGCPDQASFYFACDTGESFYDCETSMLPIPWLNWTGAVSVVDFYLSTQSMVAYVVVEDTNDLSISPPSLMVFEAFSGMV